LVQQWATVNGTHYEDLATLCRQVAIQAAQWGADQELEACLANIHTMYGKNKADCLHAMRRPKPPSLKEQALEMLENAWEGGHINNNAAQTIRRALEALPE
jgi:hypothetical protein